MSDGQVQIFPDSTGKKVDTTELTRADGTVIERQRMVSADNLDPMALARVRASGDSQVVDLQTVDLLTDILTELRQMRIYLSQLAD
jgi:hypothetical protein